MRVLSFCALFLSACGGVEEAPEAKGRTGKVLIYVVNYPLKYFAERIGGDRVEVRFPVPADVDPAFWKPTADQIAEFQQADLILFNGAGYAKWRASATLPESKCVTTFRGETIPIADAGTHSHGPAGKHAHGAIAFTTWLDLSLAAAQAGVVRDALVNADPVGEPGFDTRFSELEKDLLTLDKELARTLPKEPLIASHPVYQYLARRYGLNIRSVHWEPDEFPDEKAWAELRTILKDHPAKTMLWEGPPNPKTAAKLHDLGLRTQVLDPNTILDK